MAWSSRVKGTARSLVRRGVAHPHGRGFVPVLRAGRNYLKDEAGIRAAAIAFYAVLSFFPFVVLLASIASVFFGDSKEELADLLDRLRPFMPFLGPAFWGDVEAIVANRGVASLASLAVMFFLSSRVTVATERAIAVIFHARRKQEARRRRLRDRVRAYLLTLVALFALGVFFVTINVARYVAQMDLPAGWARRASGSSLLSGLVIPMLVVGFLAYNLYRRVPPVRVERRWALAGAALFAVGYELAVSGYAAYTSAVARQDAVYGAFVGIVSFQVWGFVVSSLALFGAELVAELNGDRDGRTRTAQAAPEGRRSDAAS